tara:strand:+ start:1228 stop:1416 length:189 start_codon:yes stop_codon:yes gene_type:complete
MKNKKKTDYNVVRYFKMDITRLKSVKNYADKVAKKTPQRVYQMAEEGKIKRIDIDGVAFIYT